MTQHNKIQLFEEKKVRAIWDDEAEKWYFSVVDVVAVLTESPNPRNYWKVLKHRLIKEGNESVTNCNQLKMLSSDGKKYKTDVADTEQLFRLIQSIPSPKAEPFKQWMAQVAAQRLDQLQDPELSIEQAMMDYKRLGYSDAWIDQRLKSIEIRKDLTDVADTEQLFRLIQSIPSPKAEPFKQWMAQVAAQRLDQLQDPELSIEQAMMDYKRLGYSDAWINQRLKSIEIRKDLTDEWKRRGLQEGVQFATLTDIIYSTWSGMTAKEYKQFKGLKKENLRDNMTNRELVLNMLAELSTKDISESQNPETFGEHIDVARQGGEVARHARMELEAKTGKPVVTSLNAKEALRLKQAEEDKT